MAHPDRTRHRARGVLWAYLLCQFALVGSLVGVAGFSPSGRDVLDAALQALSALLAAVAIYARAGSHPRSRRTWQLAGLATVLWCGGQTWITAQLAVTGHWQHPSPSDVLFIGSVVAAIAAAVTFPSLPEAGRSRLRLIVDASILAGSVLFLALGWLAGTSALSSDRVIALAYPLADCLVITVLVIAAMRAPRSLLLSLGSAAAGLLVLSVTNLETFRLSLLGSSTLTIPANAGFAVGMALIGLGALLQSAPPTERDGLVLRGQRFLPYAFLPLVLVDLSTGDGAPQGLKLALLAGIAGLLLVRQMLVVEENAGLAETMVREARQYEALVQRSSELILIIDDEARVTYRSPAVEKLLARRGARRLLDLVPSDDRAAIWAALDRCRRVPEGVGCQFSVDDDGTRRIVWAHFTDMRHDPAVGGVVVNARDVTQQAVATVALAESEQRYRRIVETAEEGIWLTDASGVTRFVNARAAELLDMSAEEIIGRPVVEVLQPFLDEAGEQVVRTKMKERAEKGVSSYDFTLSRQDGTPLHAHVTASPLFDGKGHFEGSLTMITDITARVLAEEQLRRDARTDPLTGLANRAWFTAEASRTLGGWDPGHPPALVYCDLDGFKAVNDAWGHGAGDELLQRVAERLQKFASELVLIGRLGGDEFALLITAIHDDDQPERLAGDVLAALRQPYLLSDREHHIDVSVGIALADGTDDVVSLLRNADLAMYQAKSDGRGRFRRYETAMHRRASNRLELEQDLRVALDRDELSLAYQPVISLVTGAWVGAEALVRWRHPRLGAVPPDVFIPLAEDSDLILSIGAWVLERAMKDAAAWPAEDYPHVLSVNVAPRQLKDDRHVAELERILTGGIFPSARVLLEVTERSLLAGERPRQALRTLRATGAQLALDDFGTGYSSIAHLRDHPVDVVKLDRSYVTEVAGQSPDRRLALAIVELSRQLGISCTAEGIETQAQAQVLADAGCAHGQGFLFARPMPHAELLAWFERPPIELPQPRSGEDAARFRL